MIRVITKKEYKVICQRCNSTLAYQEEDTKVEVSQPSLFTFGLISKWIVCPVCSKEIIVDVK